MRETLDLDPHVRNRDVNFGDTTTFGGAEHRTLFSLRLRESCTWTVYGTSRIEGPSSAVAGVRPIIKFAWGNGGAFVEQERAVHQRFRACVAASTLTLSARLERPDGTPPPPQVRATIVSFAARGLGDELSTTKWIHQQGAEGSLAKGLAHVERISGFNAGTDRRRWVMVFDAFERPSDGQIALFAAPAMRFATQPFSIGGADFVRGVYWCASRSPSALAFDAQALLRIDAEVRL